MRTTRCPRPPGIHRHDICSIKLIWIRSLDVQPDEIKGVARAKKSVTPEFIICLEDGKCFKSLKRHIRAQYGLRRIDQYRAKWNLPSNYPMVAPNYSATRSKLAQSMGLGRKQFQEKV